MLQGFAKRGARSELLHWQECNFPRPGGPECPELLEVECSMGPHLAYGLSDRRDLCRIEFVATLTPAGPPALR